MLFNTLVWSVIFDVIVFSLCGITQMMTSSMVVTCSVFTFLYYVRTRQQIKVFFFGSTCFHLLLQHNGMCSIRIVFCNYNMLHIIVWFESFMARQPTWTLAFSSCFCNYIQLHTSQSVRILWASNRPVTETCTWQQTTLTTDRHPWPWRDSNPQYQQASGRRHS